MNMLTVQRCFILIAMTLFFQNLAWAESVSLTWHKERAADLKDDNASHFSLSQVAVSADVFTWQGQQEQLHVGANLVRSEFDWSGTTALDSSYYWLGVPLKYSQKRSANTEVHARLEPGFMSTRDGVNKDSFFVNADLSLRFYYSQSGYGQLGAIVDRSFGDAKVYPLAVWAFKPDNITEVKLGFPYSSIQANWNSSVSTYAQVKPAGGLWIAGKLHSRVAGDNNAGEADNEGEGEPEDANPDQEENDPGADSGAGATASASSDKIKYQNWQVAVGSRFHWRDGAWLTAETGYLFNREIQALATTAKPENALFWRIGLTLEF